METTEKIYCTDSNNAALTAALMNNRSNDPMAMAAMMNGGINGANNWLNNPFMYLVFMMFANRFWGNQDNNGQNAQNIEVQSQLAALRTQMQDNQNSNLLMDAIKGNANSLTQLASNLNCDFNTLNASITDVRTGITTLAGQIGLSGEQVINAVTNGNATLASQLASCCCQTQQSILKMGYEQQLAIANQTAALNAQAVANQNAIMGAMTANNNAIMSNLASQSAQAQQDKCDILRSGELNAQRIIDTLNNHWKDQQALEIQDLKFQNSQLKQNQYIANLFNGGCGCTGYNVGQ